MFTEKINDRLKDLMLNAYPANVGYAFISSSETLKCLSVEYVYVGDYEYVWTITLLEDDKKDVVLTKGRWGTFGRVPTEKDAFMLIRSEVIENVK